MSSLANAPRASLGRRLAAWIYDFMVALAVYMLAGAALFALFSLLVSVGLIDKGGMTHNIDLLQASPVWLTLNEVGKLLAVAWLFVWSWQKKGQTLGMRAWRLRVQRPDGQELDARQAWLRASVSFGGLAMLSLLWDDERCAFHDRISGSEVVQLTVEQNRTLMNRD
ncbi:RDD family protein [Ferrimonas balearica]|uniref:RDD family protein n=1 Tax=Ferrimonas balearica TaxID=44012 RepID=UPI001C9A16F7|nr:RDD family protein [Ferrimonas balearica]MBY5992320.1 RDD family protein [Ferrimonas balearica]